MASGEPQRECGQFTFETVQTSFM